MRETKAYTKVTLECGVCSQMVWRCSGCKQSFYGGQPIYCGNDEHFCYDCVIDGEEMEPVEEVFQHKPLEDYLDNIPDTS